MFIPDVDAIEEIAWEPGTLELLEELGVQGEAIAKRLVLVYTGHPKSNDIPYLLHDTIRHRMTEEDGLPEVQIGSDAVNSKGEGYALDVEYGEFNTADEAPKGAFLRPALALIKIP